MQRVKSRHHTSLSVVERLFALICLVNQSGIRATSFSSLDQVCNSGWRRLLDIHQSNLPNFDERNCPRSIS